MLFLSLMFLFGKKGKHEKLNRCSKEESKTTLEDIPDDASRLRTRASLKIELMKVPPPANPLLDYYLSSTKDT